MRRKHKDQEEIQPVEEEPREVQEEEEPAAEKLAADIEAMQQELEQLKQDADKSRDQYLRTLADFDNYRKRQREEVARQIGLAREELILKLLPILDNFERAMQSAEQQHSYDALVEGVSLTLRQMKDMLQKEGVEPIEAVGQEFNPELHEAMMRIETDEYPENTVTDEFEKGYTIDGKVLRPARVRVAMPK